MIYTQTRTAIFRILVLLVSVAIIAGFFLLSTKSTAQKTASCSEDFFISEMMSNGAVWEMCWEERLAEGIIYHNIYYTTPDGIRRKILAEASLSQLHVPYDSGTGGRFFDITDKGFGGDNLINLQPGECREGTLLMGGSSKAKVCQTLDIHEYAYRYEGGGVPEYRMMSSLTLFNVSRAQRYFYQIVWEFHDDGTISPSVGATGKLQQYEYIDYWWRLDFDIAGEMNDVVEEFNFASDPDPRYRALQVSEILTETGRPLSPETFRSWRIKDTEIYNEDGHAISYHLEPNGNHIFRGPENIEPWSQNELYVTAFNACEVHAQRNPTIDSESEDVVCAENLSEFTNGEATDGSTDLVVWYGATFHHLPRDEDDIYMPLHRDGFHITPRGWTTEYIHEDNLELN